MESLEVESNLFDVLLWHPPSLGIESKSSHNCLRDCQENGPHLRCVVHGAWFVSSDGIL